MTSPSPKPMPFVLAGILVFCTSAIVMVLEILGTRLLAPFIGVTLQTYTAIIGTILTGISLGTWFGGTLADRVDPRRLIGPILSIGGICLLITVPIAREVGPRFQDSGLVAITLYSFATLFFPAAVLSAVNPVMAKLQLANLLYTGRTVGRLSALATAGAIAGTFATGYVFVPRFAVAPTIIAAGLTLLTSGLLIILLTEVRRKTTIAAVATLALIGAITTTATSFSKQPCDTESSYYCIKVVTNDAIPSQRSLKLDNLFHSVDDINNPTSLSLKYTRIIAGIIDNSYDSSTPLTTLSIGGGGVTMPKYVSTTRAGSQHEILEIDPTLVDVDKTKLQVKFDDKTHVRVGDARSSLPRLPSDKYDVVIGDAFGGESVPWQLTTVEFNHKIDRVMKNDGIYVLNLMDYGNLEFATAEIKTLQQQFQNVMLIGFAANADGQLSGGNIEILATNRPFTASQVQSWMTPGDNTVVLDKPQLELLIAHSPILRDDFAPVDQLLTIPRFEGLHL